MPGGNSWRGCWTTYGSSVRRRKIVRMSTLRRSSSSRGARSGTSWPGFPALPRRSGVADRDVGRFGRWASTYDEHWLQPRFFGPVQEATLRRAALLAPDPRRVLDVGCGTGVLLRKAAERFHRADL